MSGADRALLYLGLGLVLVLSPAFAGQIAAAFQPSDAYTYERVEVTPDDRSLVFDGAPPDDGIRGIDCYVEYSRLCGLEIDQLDGNVTVRKVNPIEPGGARYVEFDGRFYRRVHHSNETHVTYGLRLVPPESVLDDITVGPEESQDPTAVRRIVRQGTATIDHRLAAPGQVVAVDGSHYVFTFKRAETPRERPGSVAPLLAGGGLLAGLWSLRRGWVQYDRWRAGK